MTALHFFFVDFFFQRNLETDFLGKEREKERVKPHLDFFGAPVMIGLSIVALGKTTSYVNIFFVYISSIFRKIE